jgi:hypothetical protein
MLTTCGAAQGAGVMNSPRRNGCGSIVTTVICVISPKEQQLTTTSIVTPIVIAGTTIVTMGLSARGGRQWCRDVRQQADGLK